MCRGGDSPIRYFFTYFLCSFCFCALLTSETHGSTSAHREDDDSSQRDYLPRQAVKNHFKSNSTRGVMSHSRKVKRIKTRALTLPGDSPLPDIFPASAAVSSTPLSSTMLNRTLLEALTRASSNDSGVTRQTAAVDFTAVSVLPSEDYVHRDLPLPLLIASPVAAVSIIIFVCVAYYCHSSQLDARARQLALKYAVISTEPPACSRGIPSTSSVDMDLIRKTSLRPSNSRTSTPNPTPNGSKRGSMNWVAIGDQEVITYTAARRHSTFIL